MSDPQTLIIAVLGLVIAVVSLSWHIISNIRENRIKIEVYQRGSSVVSRVEWSQVLTFVTLETVVINVSPKATAVITGWSIELPWKDDDFDVLPEPEDEKGYPFLLDPQFRYPKKDVLNHRILEQGTLTQSHPVIYGLLIGRGTATIPSDFRHSGKIDVIVSVYDQKGKKHSGKFEARADMWEQNRQLPPSGAELMRR